MCMVFVSTNLIQIIWTHWTGIYFTPPYVKFDMYSSQLCVQFGCILWTSVNICSSFKAMLFVLSPIQPTVVVCAARNKSAALQSEFNSPIIDTYILFNFSMWAWETSNRSTKVLTQRVVVAKCARPPWVIFNDAYMKPLLVLRVVRIL